MTGCAKLATRNALAAMALAASVWGAPPRARAGPEAAGEATCGNGREARPADAGYVELQRQINELRSGLLDERERRIGWQLEASGMALVALGIAVGLGGLRFYAKFRSIATEATIGAAAARGHVLPPRGLLPASEERQELSDEAPRPIPRLVSAGLEAEHGARPSANGSSRGCSPVPPALRVFPHHPSPDDRAGPAGPALDDAELHRLEEAIADCTEAIRLDPDSSRLYLERAGAWLLECYEEAVADFDRAIGIDPDHATAYFRRCVARSELGCTWRPSRTTTS